MPGVAFVPATRRAVLALVAGALVLGAGHGCGGGEDAAGPAGRTSGGQAFPDVVDVAVSGGDGVYDFAVTVSSPYDGPDRYADGWRVLGPEGLVLGERPLAHHHGGEQPFTRTLDDVAVPPGIEDVTVQARDLVNGYGGAVVRAPLPDR